MEDKIILKFKTKNILNFYEIEPSFLINQATNSSHWVNPFQS